MATAGVRYQFADGKQISVWVSGKSTYPDAIDELRHGAAKLFVEAMRDALGIVTEVSDEPPTG